jgi:photosystem II stability/assembly factor-like uncharacterized protein/pimeloyl-ACP methyl ester carboxylesterase
MRLSALALLLALFFHAPPFAQPMAPVGDSTRISVAAVGAAASPLPRRAGSLGIRLDPQAVDRVLVREVVPGGTAAAAGVLAGDTVLAIAGRAVTTADTLRAALRDVYTGQALRIDVLRQGAPVALQVTLSDRREPVDGSTVSYRSVDVPKGYRLRSIVTVPDRPARAREGRHPALLYVQGITCDSIDRPDSPGAVDTRIVHAMARQGFVTLRVDKPGLGDSEGPPCHEIGFAEELDGYRAALSALAAMPEVDARRIYVFGHSMGGLMAPYLARDGRVRGSMVYGTLARTWFEYQLENARRQSALAGRSPAEVNAALLQQAKESSTILIDKKTLGDVWRRWPESRQAPQGLVLSENHIATRSMKFFHELQDLNLARAWQESSGAVLAIYGEYDWVTALQDHQLIADIVNARTPGAGSVLTLPQVDHAFTRHASLQDSFRAMGRGTWEAELPNKMLAWIGSVEAAAPTVPAKAEALAPQAATAAWQKLPTETYRGKQDDIFFVNERVGWYGNGDGKVFRSTDGGDSWTQVWEKKGTFVRTLAFVDEKVGVLGNVGTGYFPGVTDSVPVYRTEDGGNTWVPVTSIEGAPVIGLCAFEIVQVPFINAGRLDHRPRIIGVGRVGGPAAFIWSDDLGKTWKQGKLPAIGAAAFDVKFLDDRRGFIAASTHADVSQSNALILATDDGGANWREVYRSTRPYELTWKMSFPTPEVGYTTVQSYNPDRTVSARVLAKTTDGGRTWFEIALVDDPAVRQFGVAFLDANTGWVGAVPHGFATDDGGKTWRKAGFGNAVNKIRLVRSAAEVSGYAIGVDVHRLRMPAP